MAGNAILITVDATTAQFDRAMASADKSLLRYSYQLKKAEEAQAQFDAAVAASGASSTEARLAQERLGAALARTTLLEQKAAIEAKAAGEIQARSAAQAAAAQEAAAAKTAAAQEAAAAKQAAAVKKVGTVFGTIGVAAAVGLGLAAKAASDFNAKMAQVQSLTNASAGEMASLTQATKGFADIGASASDAADAEIELVKAGISVKDITGGALSGALNLAAAGQLDFGTATSIAASAMTQFQLQGKDIPHVADLLAAGADRALGSVQDLGEGMTYVGLGAHQLGISVDDTVAALAEFANAGLIGSQGGTTLQQVLRQLTGPTNSAALEIQELGLNLYDASGKFVGLASVAGQLHDKLGGMSQQQRDLALNTLFTSRAVRGATILYQDGASGVEKWQHTVEQSGFAAEQAAGKMDSLQGDLQKLGAEFQNAAIDFGQQLQPALRGVTQDLTAIVKVFDSLPAPVKEFGANIAVATAAVGLGVFAFTRLKTALTGMAATLRLTAGAEVAAGAGGVAMAEGQTAAAAAAQRLNVRALALRGGMAAAAIGLATVNEHVANKTASGFLTIGTAMAAGTAIAPGWGTAIGGAVGILSLLPGTLEETTADVEGFTASLDKNTGSMTKATQQWAIAQSVKSADFLAKAGISTDTYTRALLGNAAAQKTVTAAVGDSGSILALSLLPAIQKANASYNDLNHRLQETYITQGRLHSGTAEADQAIHHMGGTLLDFGVQAEQSGRKAAGAKGGVDGLGNSFADLSGAATKAYDAMEKLNNAVLERRGDFRGYQAAIDDATASLKKNGKGLSSATAKGRENSAALDQIAQSARTYADTIKDPVLQLKFLEHSRSQLLQTAHSFGLVGQDAQDYVNKVLGIPKEARTLAAFEKNKAANDVASYHDAIDRVPEFKDTVITAHAQQAIADTQRLIGLLGVIHSKDVYINVNTNFTHSGAQVQYAEGGIREGHVAQIPPAGLTRVWNEPEAGGEAYIPFAPQKRPRSRMIATEAVSRLGGEVRWHAAGAMYDRMGGAQAWRGGSDGALVAAVNNVAVRVGRVEARLGGELRTRTTNMGEMGAQAQGIAKNAIRQQRGYDARMGGTGG